MKTIQQKKTVATSLLGLTTKWVKENFYFFLHSWTKSEKKNAFDWLKYFAISFHRSTAAEAWVVTAAIESPKFVSGRTNISHETMLPPCHILSHGATSHTCDTSEIGDYNAQRDNNEKKKAISENNNAQNKET